METRDVMNDFVWKSVAWSGLQATCRMSNGEYWVDYSDLCDFMENSYREIARNLNLPYEEFKAMANEINKEFISRATAMFCDFPSYQKENKELQNLEKMFLCPDISGLIIANKDNKVSVACALFNSMSDLEKTVFLQYLEKIKITIETNGNLSHQKASLTLE